MSHCHALHQQRLRRRRRHRQHTEQRQQQQRRRHRRCAEGQQGPRVVLHICRISTAAAQRIEQRQELWLVPCTHSTARDVAVGPAAAGTAVAFAATAAKRTCGDAHRACWGCKLIAGSEATAEHPTHGLGGVSFMPAVSVCAWSAGKGRSLVAARGGSKVASGGTRHVSGCHGLWYLCSA